MQFSKLSLPRLDLFSQIIQKIDLFVELTPYSFWICLFKVNLPIYAAE